jgi:hypothetical protein
MASPEYGMQASLWWDEQAARRDMTLVADAGFTWVKQQVPWREIEGILKGHYDWYFTDRIVADAEALGMNLLFRLDRQPLWALPPDGTMQGPVEDPQISATFGPPMPTGIRGHCESNPV